MKIINKYATLAILIVVLILGFLVWRAFDRDARANRKLHEKIEILTEQVKRDSLRAEIYRKRGDSLQTVAKAFQVQASVEHLARLELLAAQKKKEDKKIKKATAREAAFAFVSSVDSNGAVMPDLFAQGKDTLANIRVTTLKKANILFNELNYARKSIEEHQVFEDDLIYIINDLNESANNYKMEADTWKKSAEDLKKVNLNMEAITLRKDKKLQRSRTWNTLLVGALGLAAVKVILF